jgi:holin-like protein
VNARLHRFFTIMWQVGLLALFSMAGNAAVDHLHWHIPGPMLGMVLLFVLLRTKLIRLDWVEAGANWLLADLLLFFIPAAVGIIQYRQAMAVDGSRVLLVIGLSTIAVMICTGLLAEGVMRYRGEDAQ